MNTDMLDIQIRQGKVKVIEGARRQVFHTTPESLGLALLRLNPNAGVAQAGDIMWTDMLGSRGLAMGVIGGRTLALQTTPAHTRTIQYRRGDVNREFTVNLPDVLMASHFNDGRLQKASLWIVKPGFLNRVTTTSADASLAPYIFGNVYGHGGICWGTTPVREIHTPQEAFDAFFNSGFNGDLFAGPGGSLLTCLQTAGAFPAVAAATFTKTVPSVIQDHLARI